PPLPTLSLHDALPISSHQIFLPLSMQCSLTSRFTKFSYALHDSNCSGTPVRGKRRNTVVRNDFNPVFRPIQNGELDGPKHRVEIDRKSTRLNSSHRTI